MIKKIKKLLFGDKDKIEYEEYIKIRNCELNKEKLTIKYRGNDYIANNKYYENGYWFYFNIEEIPDEKKEFKIDIIGENGEEFLSVIYRLDDNKIGYVTEKKFKDKDGEYPIFLEYFKDDKTTSLGKIEGLYYGYYDTCPYLYGLLFFSSEFSIKKIILKQYKSEKGEKITTSKSINECNLDKLLLQLREDKVSKIEPIVIDYLQKLKEYRDEKNESVEENID